MILETRHSIPEILSRQAMFRILGGRELIRLAEQTREYRVSRGELLFQKGERARGMFILITGQIKLYLPSETGAEKVVHLAGPGETFGEESVFLDKPYAVAAEAGKDSIVLDISSPAVLGALETHPGMARAMMARLSSRFCTLVENMETCVQRTSAERVAHYLIQQMPDDVDQCSVELESDKQTIASQLNLAPETFSRVLGKFVRAGYIHVRGRSITVMNGDGLRACDATG